MNLVLIAGLAVALQTLPPGATSPAHAPDRAPTPPPLAAAKLPDMDKVVCRRLAETGSRLGGTTECMTKAQWRERERIDVDNLRQVQSKAFQLHH